jgi:hypothetical protein
LGRRHDTFSAVWTIQYSTVRGTLTSLGKKKGLNLHFPRDGSGGGWVLEGGTVLYMGVVPSDKMYEDDCLPAPPLEGR